MHRASHHLCSGHLTAKTAVFLALASPCAWASSNAVPDWVKTAAQQTIPTLPETAKAVVLLDDETYTVDAKGQAVEHVRRVVKILRPQGRDDAYEVGEVARVKR